MTEVFARVAEVGSISYMRFSANSHISRIQCHVGSMLRLGFLWSSFPGLSDDKQGSPDVLRIEEISYHFSMSVTKIGILIRIYSPSLASVQWLQ